jgi:POT family proton-dependent oligopeptide transporter
MVQLDPSRPEPGGLRGHPAGLLTLFFTEMWERFSYYGMRALLILFMTDAVRGGLGLSDQIATSIYGLYTGGVYLLALPGGWAADAWLGARRAVWWGGILIMIGHFTLALAGFARETVEATVFFTGLILIVSGTGLLKPNISAMVGLLYPEGGARRDAGFSLFYIGINVGAALGPLVCSYLGEKVNWHIGFGAAGVGMLLGLIVYRVMGTRLGEIGKHPVQSDGQPREPEARRTARTRLLTGTGIAVGLVVAVTALVDLDPVMIARGSGVFIVSLAGLYFLYILMPGRLSRSEWRHVVVIGLFFLGAAVFWSGFEQAGSTLNLFAERHTDRSFLGRFFPPDYTHPAGYYQSVNPLFIVLLAPFIAALWVNLARRCLEPSAPLKFAIGLILLGVGFATMAGAAWLVLRSGSAVGPTWLILTYLFHTTGELCVSPIGLSWVTKLAPQRHVGQMMGIWFMGSALGNLMSGLLAGWIGEDSIEEMPRRFLWMVAVTMGTGVLFGVFARPIRRLIGDVR